MSLPSDCMSTFLAGLIHQSGSRRATILIVDNAKSHQHLSSTIPAPKNIVRKDTQKNNKSKMTKQKRTKRDDGRASPSCRWDENQGESSPVLPARHFGKNRDSFIENVTHLLNLSTENRSHYKDHIQPTTKKQDPNEQVVSTWLKRDAMLPPMLPVRYGLPEQRHVSNLMHHDSAITGKRYI
jgi:hypothetical protein